MFTTINELKGLIVDLDSMPEEMDPQWTALSGIQHQQVVFCGEEPQRQEKLRQKNSDFQFCKETPFCSGFFNQKVYTQILDMLGTSPCQTPVITASGQVLSQLQNAGIASIFFCGEKEPSSHLMTKLPDHIAWGYEDIETIISGENKGYLAEYSAQRSRDEQYDWTVMSTINTELIPIGQKPCPLIAAGRYFSQSDPRAYGHQLSKRILLHKWEETAQTELFTQIYRNIIKNTVHENVDGLTRIPPKDRRQFDRFLHIAGTLASELGAENLAEDLVCVKNYGTQKSLSRAEREANVQGVFSMEKDVSGQHILLLDDTLTSGATVREAARQLYLKGAEKVTVVVLAIKQRKNNFLEDILAPVRCRKCGGEMQLRINRTTQEAFFGCRELYNKENPCTCIEGYKSVIARRNRDAGFAIRQRTPLF